MLRSVKYRNGPVPEGGGDGSSGESRHGGGGGGCPVDHARLVGEWAEESLLCSAGRREMKLDRYVVRPIRTGADFRRELEAFTPLAAAHEKTGLLTLALGPVTAFDTAEAETRHLCALVAEAGLVDTAEEAWSGVDIRWPVRMPCPVTGRETVYTFFPVAFCRNTANVDDPLYDPALSCPFTAINTTSDAFAFAMMVRDRSRRHFGCDPYEIEDAAACRALLEASVMMWQKMSVNTMRAFSRVSLRPERSVTLSPDKRYWSAPHNDPAFAELEKHPHAHEMPVIYAKSLIDKWYAAMYDGDDQPIGLEGQSGGVPIRIFAGLSNELQ